MVGFHTLNITRIANCARLTPTALARRSLLSAGRSCCRARTLEELGGMWSGRRIILWRGGQQHCRHQHPQEEEKLALGAALRREQQDRVATTAGHVHERVSNSGAAQPVEGTARWWESLSWLGLWCQGLVIAPILHVGVIAPRGQTCVISVWWSNPYMCGHVSWCGLSHSPALIEGFKPTSTRAPFRTGATCMDSVPRGLNRLLFSTPTKWNRTGVFR